MAHEQYSDTSSEHEQEQEEVKQVAAIKPRVTAESPVNLSVFRDIKPSPPPTVSSAVSPLAGLPAKIVLQPGPAGLTYQMIPVQSSQPSRTSSQPQVVMALQPLQTSAGLGGVLLANTINNMGS